MMKTVISTYAEEIGRGNPLNKALFGFFFNICLRKKGETLTLNTFIHHYSSYLASFSRSIFLLSGIRELILCRTAAKRPTMNFSGVSWMNMASLLDNLNIWFSLHSGQPVDSVHSFLAVSLKTLSLSSKGTCKSKNCQFFTHLRGNFKRL
jgi:hypothetical protein